MTRDQMIDIIRANHYTKSVPSGKSHYLSFENAIVVFSIPANKNINNFLFNFDCKVWELSRLWAPDGHRENLLTAAISVCTGQFRLLQPDVEALVSYADPNAGHSGGIYKAASWVYLGRCAETRAYMSADGKITSRRAFHSGNTSLTKAQIEAKGFIQHNLPGKLRFARGLSRRTRKALLVKQKELIG